VGAILTFALDLRVSGVDIDVVGWILMIAGALGLVLTVFIWGGRRGRTVTDESTYVDEPRTYRRVDEPTTYRRVEERSDVGPPDRL
jgi:hypothetical protein